MNNRFIISGNIVLTKKNRSLERQYRKGLMADCVYSVLGCKLFGDKIKCLGPKRDQKLPDEIFDTETNQLDTDKGDISRVF